MLPGHRVFLVALTPAHLDYLDEAVETASTQVNTVIVPFAHDLAYRDAIPGLNKCWAWW